MKNILIKLRREILKFYIWFVKFLIKDILLKFFLLICIKQKYKNYVFYNFFDNNDKILNLKLNSNIKASFVSRSLMTEKRYTTLFSKEPDTIDWINSFEQNSIFYDIGANVGIYSVYASILHKNIDTIAFEPSVFNLEILSKNIYINNLHDRVSIYPISLDVKKNQNQFNMSKVEVGGALSGFGTELDEFNNQRDITFKYKTFSQSLDDFVDEYNLKLPNYIKIDVDGIELSILNGAIKILNSNNIKSILIENTDPKSGISSFLEENNFQLISKLRNNEIWKKIS